MSAEDDLRAIDADEQAHWRPRTGRAMSDHPALSPEQLVDRVRRETIERCIVALDREMARGSLLSLTLGQREALWAVLRALRDGER